MNLAQFPPALDWIKQTWLNIAPWLQTNLASDEFHALNKLWEEAEAFWARDAQTPVLTHGDLWPENILLDPSQCLSGIIDFGSARIGDPAIDFAVPIHVSDAFRDEVVEQYVRLGGNIGEALDKRMAYLLALREFYGLEYGLMTGFVDPDSFKKIRGLIPQL